MTDYQDAVPSYLTIRVTPQEGPIAAFAEQEAWEATKRYPELMGVGAPEFFHARELDTGGWELLGCGDTTPQAARDSLGSHFRMQAKDANDAGDEKARRTWMTAALRMDREVVNDIRTKGERFRIVRASRYIRMGDSGPEPPRPSDPDTAEVGEAYRLGPGTEGLVIDPYTGTGLSAGLLKLDLIQFVGVAPGAPPEVAEEARQARVAYPGGVLMPAVFMISQRRNGKWGPFNPGHSSSTPQGARDSLASWLRVSGPFTLQLDEDRRAEYAALADRLDKSRSNVTTIDGVRYRVTRVERLVRVGPDGPEGPRPSDYDPEPPIDIHVRQLKERGLWEDDESKPIELDERTKEWKRLSDAEAERLREQRRKRGRG